MSPEARERSSQRSQCTGKRRYRDRTEANTIRHARSDHIDHSLRVYECPFCNGFHLTKQAEHGAPQ